MDKARKGDNQMNEKVKSPTIGDIGQPLCMNS